MTGDLVVTRIEAVNRKKSKIWIDEEYAFFLYEPEMIRYRIAEGTVLAPETLQEIRQECVLRHAVEKAMSLLKVMDRTENEMWDRLHREGFPDDACAYALAYVMSYGYVDDASYADRYVYSHMDRESVRTLRQKLLQKGIDSELIEQAIEENAPDEEQLLRRLIEKKTHGEIPRDPKEKQKLIRFLLSRGFSYASVGKALDESAWEESI
ncbi:MAG: regulatory protein RecX [Lachnospiraceae bacterium]|nr:regulatory protein RecX [Lachnospiraceae bacterium]